MRISLAGVLAPLVLAALAAGAEYQEKLLHTFEAGAEGWTAANGASLSTAAEHATDGRRSLKVNFSRAQSYFELGSKLNLKGWDKLKLDVFNSGQPFNVTLRANDAAGHSYTCWYQRLGRGKNTLEYALRGFASRVPQKGKVASLDLSQMTLINIRADQKIPRPVDVYIDNVRLTRGDEPFVRPVASAAGKAVAEVAGNILSNSDFELGLQGWGSWGTWDGGKYSFGSGRGDYARTGSASAEITCEKRGRGGIFTSPMPVKRGQTYKLTLWARGKGGAILQLTTAGRVGPVPERWKKYEFNIPMNGNTYRLYIYNVGTGSLFVDTVSLVPPGGASSGTARAADEKPSKVTVRGDRTFVNGKPFFPIGIYGVSDPKADLAGTGMNFAIGGATGGSADKWYTACRKAGVMTIANLTGLLRGHLPHQAPAATARMKGRAALLGYYICDEPDHGAWNVPPPEIRQAHHMLKESDPNHPTIVLVMAWHRSMAYQYADTADIIASDPYSITDMDKPVRSTLWMDDALARKQPVWAVLQAGWDNTKPPSPEAIVCQAWSSVACGADAIIWFERKWCNRHPAQWTAIKKVSRELREVHDDLCNEEPEGIQPSFSDGRVIGTARKTPRGMLLVTVNKTLARVGQVEITLPSVRSGTAKELFGGGSGRVSGGKLRATFGPGERHVYRIAGPGAR